MSGKYLLKKFAATALVAALGTSFAVFGAPTAKAETVTKAVNLSCRTNGAPMKYNVTRAMKADVVITTPANVQAGEDAIIRVEYLPEKTPGKESIATMKQLKDIVVRFTLDDPTAFVTAKAVGQGNAMMNPATVSLVGGNMLVLSGMNAAINGQDTNWAPPAVEITMKAPADGKVLKTVHLAVEGPAGEFNNPANAMTMKTVTESILGELTIQLNCQALSGAETFSSVPIVGAAPAGPKADNKNVDKVDKKADNKANTKKDGKATSGDSTTATVSTDANGLQRVDEDIYAEEFEGNNTPGWLIAVIVIACLGIAAGVGYGIYRGVKNKKGV